MKFYLNIEAESLSELLAQLNVPASSVGTCSSNEASPLVGSGAREDAFDAADESAENEPDIAHFAVNLYHSRSVAFALGARVFESDHEAKRGATPGYISTVGFDIDLNTGKVMCGLPIDESPDTRFFALRSFDDPSFSGGYSTRQAARTNNPDAAAIVGICNRTSGSYAG